MPSYKDSERLSPKGLAKFILKDQVCKNCKYTRADKTGSTIVCSHILLISFISGCFYPPQDFGCNLFEKEDN